MDYLEATHADLVMGQPRKTRSQEDMLWKLSIAND